MDEVELTELGQTQLGTVFMAELEWYGGSYGIAKKEKEEEKFGDLVPTKSEPWKKPLGQFIESCYYKRFWPTRPIYNRYVKQHVCCPTILLGAEEGMQSNVLLAE